MNYVFYNTFMTLCDLGILHMYNETRNTTEKTDLKESRCGIRLGKRIRAQENFLFENKNLYSKLGAGELDPIEKVVYDSIVSAAADNKKSDVFSPYGLCCIFYVLLQITEGTTKQALLNILENYELKIEDSFYENIKSHIIFFFHEDKCKTLFNVIELIIEFKDTDKRSDTFYSTIYKKTSKIFSSLFSPQIESPLFLMNTVYITSEWLNKFNPRDTKMKKFYNKKCFYKIPMMRQKGVFNYLYADGLRFIRIDLENFSESLCLVIVLPDTNFYIPPQLHMEFKNEFKRLATRDCQYYTVDLEIPKFKIETECNLNKVFNGLLSSDIINKDLELNKDFSPYDTTKMNIKHKTIIEFSESGICTGESYSQNVSNLVAKNTISFFCNRSFVFYLLDIRNSQVLNSEGSFSFIFPVLVGRYTGPKNN
ncbi:serpin-type proteinase inhibitor 22 [Vairimorpha necatrix]|uniref:Serpin-type proteinase inhibitor 22 n=1 Tax=Vairimorpha necatrix TaxID=6039 RepID=A0AAX4JEZ3_9MICR